MEKSKCCLKCFETKGEYFRNEYYYKNYKCPCHTPQVTESEECNCGGGIEILHDKNCRKYLSTQTDEVEDWEKELKAKLWELGHTSKDAQHIVDFISNLLSSNTERVKKNLFQKIKDYDFKENHICRFNDGEQDCECFIKGLNVALNYINNIK